MARAVIAYVTAPDRDVARHVGRALVEKKLAACVNILGQSESIYLWDGEICSDDEIVLIAKTTTTAYPDLERCIVDMHPYDCPCVVAIGLEAGHADFLNWIEESTATGKG